MLVAKYNSKTDFHNQPIETVAGNSYLQHN